MGTSAHPRQANRLCPGSDSHFVHRKRGHVSLRSHATSAGNHQSPVQRLSAQSRNRNRARKVDFTQGRIPIDHFNHRGGEKQRILTEIHAIILAGKRSNGWLQLPGTKLFQCNNRDMTIRPIRSQSGHSGRYALITKWLHR